MQQGVLTPLLKLLNGGPDIEESLRTQAMRTLFEMVNSSAELAIRLCEDHKDVVKCVIGLLLLEEHLGGATQREASKVVQVGGCSHACCPSSPIHPHIPRPCCPRVLRRAERLISRAVHAVRVPCACSCSSPRMPTCSA